MNFIINKFINFSFYHWRRLKWLIDPYFYTYIDKKITINSPVFLIGNEGAGLTLISRMIRRNPEIVNITGNYEYWSGADEMGVVFEPVLPQELGGLRFKAPKYNKFPPPRGWSYATDKMLSYYRNSKEDFTKKHKYSIEKVIKYCLKKYRPDGVKVPRFIDKTQVYTIKVSFINELLKEYNPKFILITRNPYASCYRAATGKAGDMKRYKKHLSFRERLEFCTEHWSNSMNCALKDKEKENIDMKIIRFEDILNKPIEGILKICDFINLDFHEDMIPKKHHRIPLGSKYRDRWYPLRPDVNEKYLKELEPEYIKIINSRCKELAEKFEYSP